MTSTTVRQAVRGRSIETPPGSSRRPRVARFAAALHHGVHPVRRAPARPVQTSGAGPVWSLLLPSYCTKERNRGSD
jgi:hypothetical protein